MGLGVFLTMIGFRYVQKTQKFDIIKKYAVVTLAIISFL